MPVVSHVANDYKLPRNCACFSSDDGVPVFFAAHKTRRYSFTFPLVLSFLFFFLQVLLRDFIPDFTPDFANTFSRQDAQISHWFKRQGSFYESKSCRLKANGSIFTSPTWHSVSTHSCSLAWETHVPSSSFKHKLLLCSVGKTKGIPTYTVCWLYSWGYRALLLPLVHLCRKESLWCVSEPHWFILNFYFFGMNGYLSDLCSSEDTCQWRCIHSNCIKYYKCLLYTSWVIHLKKDCNSTDY